MNDMCLKIETLLPFQGVGEYKRSTQGAALGYEQVGLSARIIS